VLGFDCDFAGVDGFALFVEVDGFLGFAFFGDAKEGSLINRVTFSNFFIFFVIMLQ
jgi:hypothetical protein